MDKYWTGYNIYCSWVWPFIICIKTIVDGLIYLNNGIFDYWRSYRVGLISSVFVNVLRGVKGIKCDVIICFWSDNFSLLSDYCSYADMCGYLWFIEAIEGIHIFNNFMTAMDECKLMP